MTRGRRLPLALLLLALVGATSVAPTGTSAAPVAGEAGTDTALPLTDSAVSVRGRGVFESMEFTINQTADLTNQAVSITWTGGTPTRPGPGDYGAHFVQIFQCWGDDDGSVPGNPGPPPEQCQMGAVAGRPEGVNPAVYPNGYALQRIITRTGLPNAAEVVASGAGVADRISGNIFRPFRAVDGTVVDLPVNSRFNPSVQGGNYWLNPYFDINTTNEIAGARTGPNGRGSELFQVNTGKESSGLGCGQRVQPAGDGTKKVPQCWIVIVPRGEPTVENDGMGVFEETADQFGVFSSPLSPTAWQNRIAVPVDFKPVDNGCALGADERRIVGTELVQAALASWQPALCTNGALPPFNFAPVSDAGARQQLAASTQGGPGMAVVSRPLSSAAADPASPAVYAPLSISGLVVGFNVERLPRVEAPQEAQQLRGVRVATIDLTPRLLAKLLTQSYRSQVAIGGVDPGYEWVRANPATLTLDPDFLRFNPEFELLRTDERLTGGLIVPSGSFDAALQLWEYLFADPEAKAWLDGTPDEWGMKVNPAYSTDAASNPSGVPFGSPLPSSFPKADPYCYQAPAQAPAPGLPATIVPTPLCGTDWMPYVARFSEAAQNVRSGNDIAKIVNNPTAQTAAAVWIRDAPKAAGTRTFLAVTDTASAARLGLQTARLSRAGDGGDDREFVAPTLEGMQRAVAVMAPRSEPTVLEPNPLAEAPGAYPLTAITYAVVKPLSLDAASRKDFAAFVEYAAGAGQVRGIEIGQLPQGYASLPAALAQQATTAAEQVRTLTVAPAATPTTSTTAPANTSPAPVVASSGTGGGRPTSTGSGGRPVSSSSGSSDTANSGIPSDTPSSEVPASSLPTTEASPTTVVATDETVPATTSAPAVPLTPGTSLARSRYVIVGLLVSVLLAALGALEITKRARRATTDPDDDDHDDAAFEPSSSDAHDDAPVELTIDA